MKIDKNTKIGDLIKEAPEKAEILLKSILLIYLL